MVFMEYAGLRLFVKVLRIPKYVLLPVIMALCCVGAFGLNNRIFDILVTLFMGFLGFIMIKLKIPLPPLLLGFILGPVIELNLIRGLMYSNNDWFAFIKAPIAAVFLFISLLVVVMTAYKQFKRTRTQ
jgi:putative tricarboxylic transport membrane protein